MIEDIKVKIINLLTVKNVPLEAFKIAELLNISLQDVCESLVELEKELKIRITKRGKYVLTDYKFGKLKVIKNGAGFVVFLSGEDLYIKKANMKNAIHGDDVVVEIINEEQKEGRIIKVLSHDKNNEIGQVITINSKQYIKLDDIKKKNILLAIETNPSLVDGHKVVAGIGKLIKEDVFSGYVIKVFGHVNDPGIDITTKAVMFDIETIFPAEVLEEANKVPVSVSETDLIGRRDLRNKIIFTIDGIAAMDLDDAVSIEILPNGNYLLGVHIEDVAHYVKTGSLIDKEAYKRGTSSYFANRVIPMLPHILSNGICSLNENVDRLTRTCMMEYDVNGKLVNYEIFKSVINSKKRMNYKAVDDVLKGRSKDETYLPFLDDLQKMQDLSNILRLKRERNGSIDFDTNEMKIIVDENGRATDILRVERIDSEKIIEDFMLAANETVATHISYMDLPFIYRVHGAPDNEKLAEFIRFAKLMNEKVLKLPKNIHSKVISEILKNLRDSPDFDIYSNLLLKCMQKAVYDVNNIGHFGLALDNYTHFTSPIRRYPDLLVHRFLDEYEKGEIFNDENSVDNLLCYLADASRHSSVKEQNTVKCERAINKMKAAEYMESHLGEVFTGKIISLNEIGFCVDIYNGIEGLVKLIDLNGGYYDQDRYFINTSENIVYKIGDYVEVIVEASLKELGQIDLSLVRKVDKPIKLEKNLMENANG